MAWLDHFFYSVSVLPLLVEASIHDILILDHSPVSILLHDATPKPKVIMWRFPVYLAGDKEFQEMIKKEWDDYTHMN